VLRPAILVALTFCLAAVSLGQSGSIAATGKFNGQEYSNPKLGFSILVPGGWTFYDSRQNRAAVEQNVRIAAASGDQHLLASSQNTEVLFQAVPPAFDGQEKQAILSVGVEKIGKQITANAYASLNRSLVLGQSGARLTRDLYTEVLPGGPVLVGFEVEGARQGNHYQQRYLITIRHDVAIFIVATFYDDRQKSFIDASLRTIKFAR